MASKSVQPAPSSRSTGGARAGAIMRQAGKQCKASVRENCAVTEAVTDKQRLDKSTLPKQQSAKMTTKMLNALDVLTLDQISQLNDKVLLDMFTDLSSDEMTRNYTYTCYLIPSKCSAAFKSFGSEARAQANAISHLKVHLTDLINDAEDPATAHKLKFTAEPMTARFRRLSGLAKTPKKKQGLRENVTESELKSDTKENEPATSPSTTEIRNAVASRDGVPLLGSLPCSPKREPTEYFENMEIDRAEKRRIKGHKRLPATNGKLPTSSGAAKSRSKPTLENEEENGTPAIMVATLALTAEKPGSGGSKRGAGTPSKQAPDAVGTTKRKRALSRASDGSVGTAAKMHKASRGTLTIADTIAATAAVEMRKRDRVRAEVRHKRKRAGDQTSTLTTAATIAATAAVAKGSRGFVDGSSGGGEVGADELKQPEKRQKREPDDDHCYFTSSCERCCKDSKRSRDTSAWAPSVAGDGSAGSSAARTCVPYSVARPPVPPSFSPGDRRLGEPTAESSPEAAEPTEEVMLDYVSPHNVMTVKIKTGYLLTCNSVSIPIMQLAPVVPVDNVVSVVGAEVTVELDVSSSGGVVGGSSGTGNAGTAEHVPLSTSRLARPYPPMPKYPTQHGLRLIVPEEEVQFLDEDLESTEEQPPGDVDSVAGEDMSAAGDEQQQQQEQHREGSTRQDLQLPAGSTVDAARYREKMLAIKCIRELKSGEARHTSDHLRCKVCSKTFTASATLMYHYRSHAGIKPFMCLLCNNYFTRQHSLNYHMLIHTGQSRFKCPDCGRAFRHPSHFKEHQRRHTGETPFECTDCSMKFKTRNTFKRHLKTRHCKLLTAKGIHKIEGIDLKASRSPSDSCSSGDPSKDVENEEDAHSPNASESSESEASAE